jgi:hypothetical protein
VDPR